MSHSGSKVIIAGSSLNIDGVPGVIDRKIVPPPIVVDLKKHIDCDINPNITSLKTNNKDGFGVTAVLDIPMSEAIKCGIHLSKNS